VTTTPAGETRRLTLDGCFNFRDLGGYETLDGRSVRWRRLFRADGPHALTESDAATLARLGIATIIDLRTVDESEQRGRWQDHLGDATYHHLPMTDVLPDEAEMMKWVEAAHVGDHYGKIASRGTRAIASALVLFGEEANYPAMFHCSAGKDRTGVLAAIVLGLVGVPDETIVDDYALSREAMERMWVWLRANASDPDQLDRYAPAVRSAEPLTMRVFLDGLRGRYGSYESYAAALGLGDADLAALRAALLEG
jgi:protein-tyrosine phosphatase